MDSPLYRTAQLSALSGAAQAGAARRLRGIKTVASLALLLCAFALQAAPPVPTIPAPLLIVQNHTSQWRIVCPPPGSTTITWAAAELQRHVRQMSGCKLPLVQRSPTKPALVVGRRNELTPADRGLLPEPVAGFDGYAIAIVAATRKTPPRIVVGAESSRGVLFGVYDLLERCGCRWSNPAQEPAQPELIPQQPTLRLAPGAWAVAWPEPYRSCSSNQWSSPIEPALALKQLDWAAKARFNTLCWQADTQRPFLLQYQALQSSGLLSELAKRELFLQCQLRGTNRLLRPEQEFKAPPELLTDENSSR